MNIELHNDGNDGWHWTDEERAWLREGSLTPDADHWSVQAPDGDWQVWKGFHELSHRLYQSPTGCYFLGDIEDEPPYSYECSSASILAEENWCGRVWPGCEPGDTREFRRHMAAHWFNDQGHEMPEDLRDVTRQEIDAMQDEIARRFDAAWPEIFEMERARRENG